MTKLKAFAASKLNIAKMMVAVLTRLENTVGKWRKCWLPAFSPFPTVFSKDFFLTLSQTSPEFYLSAVQLI